MNARIPPVFRTVAILIAIAGVIDPAVTSERSARPEVALVAGSSGDTLLARRVRAELDDDFTVVDGPFAGAAGTVLVGGRLPTSPMDIATPVMAVVPDRDAAMVTIEDVSAPSRAPLEARAAISVHTRASGARGSRLEVSLLRGDLLIDRVSGAIERDDHLDRSELSFIPTVTGAVPLRVTAGIVDGSGAAARADVLLDVEDQRRAVLFFDPRPSWQSTFVRRAIERDPRFVVSSRVITSRNIGTEAGRPPASLENFEALSLFDAIVVGAPDALGQRDVAGLEAYLRRRGGAVILLLDQRASGPYQRLAGVREWDAATSGTGFSVTPVNADSTPLRASELAWPRRLPPGARVLALSWSRGADSSVHHPVVWRSAIGAGELIVCGALDAWRYRDPAVSAFDAFWRTTVAAAADRAMPGVAVSLDASVVRPGDRTGITVTLRDASLAALTDARPVRATIAASIETPDGPVPFRLWPDGAAGRFRGVFRAPATAGIHRVSVTADGARADAPILVSASSSRPDRDESEIVRSWVGSRGGSTFPAARIAELRPALHYVLPATARRETWYPMRSGWWIIPFAAALGLEWMWRRRRGLA